MSTTLNNTEKTIRGADKLTIEPVLDAVCLSLGIKTISESTIGRIIKELKEKGRIPNYRIKTTINGKTDSLRIKGAIKKEKKLRIGSFKPQGPGDLVQVDAIAIFLNGIKKIYHNCAGCKDKDCICLYLQTLSSSTAKDFIQRLREILPFDIRAVQTDNGAEFHKYFRDYLKAEDITHYYNYPGCPKMNTFIERFNRTIQDQHISRNMHLYYEPNEANQKLMKYLLWYNTERAHRSVGKVPPMRYFINNYIQPEKSDMLWTATRSCNLIHKQA